MKTNNKNRYLMVLGLSIFGVVSDVSAGGVKRSKAMEGLNRQAEQIAADFKAQKEKEERDYKEKLRLADEERKKKLDELEAQRQRAEALEAARRQAQQKRFDNARKPIEAQTSEQISDFEKQAQEAKRSLFDAMNKQIDKLEADAWMFGVFKKPKHQQYREAITAKQSDIVKNEEQMQLLRRRLEFYPKGSIDFSKKDETEEVSSWFGLKKSVARTPDAAKVKAYQDMVVQLKNLNDQNALLEKELKTIEQERNLYIQNEMYKSVQTIKEDKDARVRNIQQNKIPELKKEAKEQIENLDPRSWYEKLIGEEILIDTKKEESLFGRFKKYFAGSDKEQAKPLVVNETSDENYDDLIDPEKAFIDRVKKDNPQLEKLIEQKLISAQDYVVALKNGVKDAMNSYKESFENNQDDKVFGPENKPAEEANLPAPEVVKPVVTPQGIAKAVSLPVKQDVGVQSLDPVVPAAVKQENPKMLAIAADVVKLDAKVDDTMKALLHQIQALESLQKNTQISQTMQKDIQADIASIKEHMETLAVAAHVAKVTPNNVSAVQAAEKIANHVVQKHDLVLPQVSAPASAVQQNIAREVEALQQQSNMIVPSANDTQDVDPVSIVEYQGPEYPYNQPAQQLPIEQKIEEKVESNGANLTGSWPSGVSMFIGLVSDHPYVTAAAALGVVSVGCYWMYKKRCATQARRAAMQERFAGLDAQVNGHGQRLDNLEQRVAGLEHPAPPSN